ncbi:hypothetical protein N2152v2_000149 [Parachlorella kessleri]
MTHAGAAFYQHEWELYRAENDFHQRTLRLVHQVTQTIRHEWDLYRAEMGQLLLTPSSQLTDEAKEAAYNQVVQLVEEAVAAEAGTGYESAEEGMHPGGYHPAYIGENFKSGRYTAVRKLGQGHYSTVWMVHDKATGADAAMKIVRSAENYTEAAKDELTLLGRIQERDPFDTKHCVQLLDSFYHEGPHGLHVCEVFEAMGDDLLTLIRVYGHQGIPIPIVRHLVRQMLVALDYLHGQCQIIHLDLKPENVMLAEPVQPVAHSHEEQPEVDMEQLEPRLLRMGCKVVDFGNACWTHTHFTDDIQTRPYRSPEAILGAEYNETADIWSLACMIFELVTGEFLFYPQEPEAGGAYVERCYSKDQDHLAQMIELLQHIPPEVATRGKYAAAHFTSDGRLRQARSLQHWPLERVLTEKYGLPWDEALALRDFLLPMLSFDPARRATAAEMLQHPWLKADHQPLRPTTPARGAGTLGKSPSRSPSPMPASDYQHHSPRTLAHR